MKIISDGVFTVPLYHGTAGLFIESIEHNGLGSIDPIVNLEAKKLMLDLLDLADKQNWKDEKWFKYRSMIEPYALQKNINNILNFTHGETYVTGFKVLAEKYAKESFWGSEFLTYLGCFIWFLGSRETEGLVEMVMDHPISPIIKKRHDPYIITMNNVALADVATESNQNIKLHIEEIEKLLDLGVHGPQSFKLTKTISAGNLIVDKIGFWNERNELIPT